MPSTPTTTPAESRRDAIKRLADQAKTISALLSVINILNAEHQQGALLDCSSMADDFAHDLDLFVGAPA